MKKVMIFAIVSLLISTIGLLLIIFRPWGIDVWLAVAIVILGCILEIIAMDRLMAYSLKRNKE